MTVNKEATRNVWISLTLVQGLKHEIPSELMCEIKRVLLKTNLHDHSMMGLYTSHTNVNCKNTNVVTSTNRIPHLRTGPPRPSWSW